MSKKARHLKTLGRTGSKFKGLETFKAPPDCKIVTCVSDEVTAVCPVTGQPDWYKVTLEYLPHKLCVESKTLKLFLQSFRNEGHFCEDFSQIIARKLFEVLRPYRVRVTVLQKARGGIAIEAASQIEQS